MTDLFAQAYQDMVEGMNRVEANAEPSWQDRALLAILITARRRTDFISDDVWEIGNLPETRENRALGPIFMKAKAAGWIEKTDRVRPSVRSHLSGKPVWRSLIFENDSLFLPDD